jgi:hypothetical protein
MNKHQPPPREHAAPEVHDLSLVHDDHFRILRIFAM